MNTYGGVINEEDNRDKKRKAIPVTGLGGPKDFETPRLTHFPDNRLTDGGEVVSHMRQRPFTPQEGS
jgi:hypothetical protein